jgi:hypothetical protein
MKPWYVAIWDEGGYVDFWSINHTLGGVLSLLFIALTGIPKIIGFPIIICLASLWEVYEHVTGIEETFSNRIIDIVVAAVAFFVMYWIIQRYQSLNLVQLFVSFGLLTILLNVWGFWAMEIEKTL